MTIAGRIAPRLPAGPWVVSPVAALVVAALSLVTGCTGASHQAAASHQAIAPHPAVED